MVDKEKCKRWFSLLVKTLKMADELTSDELNYIEAQFSLEVAKQKINELEAKDDK